MKIGFSDDGERMNLFGFNPRIEVNFYNNLSYM